MGLSGFEDLALSPYICGRLGQVAEINDVFLTVTGFCREELMGKELLYVLNELLKVNKKVESIDKMNGKENCFFFNKFLDFKEAIIEVHKDPDTGLTYLVFKQQPLISINNPLSYTHQLISDNLVGIAIYSAEDFTLLKASKEYERIIYERYQQSDIIGKKIYEFSKDWMESMDRKDWEAVIKSKRTVFNKEFPSLNSFSGTVEYFDSSIAPILDDNKVKFLVLTMNNITEKVNYRIENEHKAIMIEEQKELLETVIEKQKDSIFIIDRNGIIVLNNKAGQREPLKVQLKTIKDIYRAGEYFDEAGNQLSFEQLPIHRVMRGEKIDNLKLKLKLKKYIKHLNLNGTPIYNEAGKFQYAFIYGTDITELEESKQLLIQQKEQLEAIMDNMSDAIFIVDKKGKYIMQNKAAKEYFNLELEQVEEAYRCYNHYELNGRSIPYEEMPIARLKKGIKVLDKVVLTKTPSKEMYASISAAPIFDQQGDYLLGVLSIRDITEFMKNEQTIREQQQALLQAEKKEKESLEKLIEMKDEFLSLISHEFKTPLTVINSALQAMELLYKDQLTDKIRAYLDRIKQNTYRQVRLVNNILDITGANAGHIKLNMRNLDIIFITKVILESVNVYAQQKGVNLHFKSDMNEKIIAIDEEKYERILLNLLSNAIKFTPKDKNIVVEIAKAKGHIKVIVADEGIGIPDGKHELIFERFGQVENTYTRQAEGTGIGLSLVKLIVNAMGGSIAVQSKLGVGSTFTVELLDRTIQEECKKEKLQETIDARLIQSIAIEFSDIYF